MFLQLLGAQRRKSAGPISTVVTLPPPIGGWNARDALPLMDPKDAIRLDNVICDLNGVRMRPGSSTHGTTLTGSYVETLMEYSPPSGSNKLFAALPAIIYDVTSAGAGTSSVTSMSNGRWSHTNFSTGAGTNVLYICNGTDDPRYYDGSSWSTSTFSGSGLTIANLDFVHAHMNRLWFIEKNTANVWYGPTAAITGTLSKWALQPLLKSGGKLIAIGSWSRDGGNGPDDYIVFVSSKGEVIVYAGTDPSSSTTSALVGVYRLGEPIGRRCMIKAGADLAILTSQGLVPLSQVTGLNISGQTQTSITNKISAAFRDAYLAVGTSFGWQVIEYPKRNIAIVNVPIAERVTAHQYVINTLTGAWSRFTGINAGCWGMLGDDIHWGGFDGKTYVFDSGFLDASSRSIVVTYQSSYTDFGSPRIKHFKGARPTFFGPASFTPHVYLRTDYDTSTIDMATIGAIESGTAWDEGDWDTSSWAEDTVPSRGWQTVAGMGVTGSVAYAVSAQSELVFNGVDVMLEAGGYL
jgi:hypothetical protein